VNELGGHTGCVNALRYVYSFDLGRELGFIYWPTRLVGVDIEVLIIRA
jgi:hypothetical protein